ncbi:MAG: MBL fold metallo-hydrolase [Synergistaceae bacterium]|jgi:phosphoribosyl 1,2-cyclic phosphodiesterase
MRLIVLSSDSTGNGYLLKASDGEVLILEAGVRLSKVKRALDFNLEKIAGLVVSHTHEDHARYLLEYQAAGIPCYVNEDTKRSRMGEMQFYNTHVVEAKKRKVIGNFMILPFELEHDVQNYGYLIHHHESGLICFLTDTHYCRYKFNGLNNILVEANYSQQIIDQKLMDGKGSLYVRNRVLTHHMELETCRNFLAANDLSHVNKIILLHLSAQNSDVRMFQSEIQKTTGKTVYVAYSGFITDLNKTPF